MSASADTIYYEMLQILQLLKFFICNVVHVSAVGDVAKTVSKYGKSVVSATDRGDLHRFCSIFQRNLKRLIINEKWCKGCGICVAFCPKQVLVLKKGKVTKANPDACIKCGQCEQRCPDYAIYLEKVEEGAN